MPTPGWAARTRWRCRTSSRRWSCSARRTTTPTWSWGPSAPRSSRRTPSCSRRRARSRLRPSSPRAATWPSGCCGTASTTQGRAAWACPCPSAPGRRCASARALPGAPPPRPRRPSQQPRRTRRGRSSRNRPRRRRQPRRGWGGCLHPPIRKSSMRWWPRPASTAPSCWKGQGPMSCLRRRGGASARGGGDRAGATGSRLRSTEALPGRWRVLRLPRDARARAARLLPLPPALPPAACGTAPGCRALPRPSAQKEGNKMIRDFARAAAIAAAPHGRGWEGRARRRKVARRRGALGKEARREAAQKVGDGRGLPRGTRRAEKEGGGGHLRTQGLAAARGRARGGRSRMTRKGGSARANETCAAGGATFAVEFRGMEGWKAGRSRDGGALRRHHQRRVKEGRAGEGDKPGRQGEASGAGWGW
mmetsp:Transcript_15112/g.51208  ORF Transcript_15112/g.51208 Transcript_15112/m.51208 type:complete len:420 (+) Transcript_15112:813-2072(+)